MVSARLLHSADTRFSRLFIPSDNSSHGSMVVIINDYVGEKWRTVSDVSFAMARVVLSVARDVRVSNVARGANPVDWQDVKALLANSPSKISRNIESKV